MVTKCANPECKARFLYFREGRLFVTQSHTTGNAGTIDPVIYPRFYWLCERCSAGMTLEFDNEGNSTIVPKNPAKWYGHSLSTIQNQPEFELH